MRAGGRVLEIAGVVTLVASVTAVAAQAPASRETATVPTTPTTLRIDALGAGQLRVHLENGEPMIIDSAGLEVVWGQGGKVRVLLTGPTTVTSAKTKVNLRQMRLEFDVSDLGSAWDVTAKGSMVRP